MGACRRAWGWPPSPGRTSGRIPTSLATPGPPGGDQSGGEAPLGIGYCLRRCQGAPPQSGSNGSDPGGVPERPKGADCKSAGSAFPGSNPGAATLRKTPPHYGNVARRGFRVPAFPRPAFPRPASPPPRVPKGPVPPGTLAPWPRLADAVPNAVERSPSSPAGSPGTILPARGRAGNSCPARGPGGRHNSVPLSPPWTGTSCPTSPGSCRCSERHRRTCVSCPPRTARRPTREWSR